MMGRCLSTKKRGGKREGAGRKRRDTQPVQVRLRPATIERIRKEAEVRGCSLGEVIEQYFNSEV